MLKLEKQIRVFQLDCQPPSGGCVLKPTIAANQFCYLFQPPSGGCVLKRERLLGIPGKDNQPPSGGCVLKLLTNLNYIN